MFYGLLVTSIFGISAVPLDYEIKRKAALCLLRNNNQQKVTEMLEAMVGSKKEVKGNNNRIMGKRMSRRVRNGKGWKWVRDTVHHRRNMDRINPSRGLVHFLTRHGLYLVSLHRFGLKEEPICECVELRTPQHVLYLCPLVDPRTQHLSDRLGDPNTSEALRCPGPYGSLNALADAVSREQMERFRRRH